MRNTPLMIIALLAVSVYSVYAQGAEYTIKKGDTLYGISRQYGISLDKLKAENNITDPSLIKVGTKIVIPGIEAASDGKETESTVFEEYLVMKGDTCYGIARKFGMPLSELLAVNSLGDGSLLRPGQVLSLKPEILTASVDASGGDVCTAPLAAEVKESSALVDKEDSQGAVLPHHGRRSILDGKLKGLRIEGREGDSVRAVTDGTVVWASRYSMYRNLVIVESGDGLMYGYGGNDRMAVKMGDRVEKGGLIGYLGGAENAEAYFFVYADGKPLDPQKMGF